ncbi:hypothetical protein RRG08_034204 [Elysia crispata]|uniref:Uncharacterized protein n=1 Tax=Elysia crispata TaxID=231223 RepID=A0AAE1A1I8_9GAST|nr:hypothetical protein RRG08_034204 [Elysia crispata]
MSRDSQLTGLELAKFELEERAGFSWDQGGICECPSTGPGERGDERGGGVPCLAVCCLLRYTTCRQTMRVPRIKNSPWEYFEQEAEYGLDVSKPQTEEDNSRVCITVHIDSLVGYNHIHQYSENPIHKESKDAQPGARLQSEWRRPGSLGVHCSMTRGDRNAKPPDPDLLYVALTCNTCPRLRPQ